MVLIARGSLIYGPGTGQHFTDDSPCHATHSINNRFIIGRHYKKTDRLPPVDLLSETLDLCAGMKQQNFRNHFPLVGTGKGRLPKNARG